MYKISSRLTNVLTNVLPWIIIACIVLFLLLYIISDKDFLIGFIIQFILFLVLWFFFFRNLQTVYLEDKKLKIYNLTLPFKNIIAINKFFLSPTYQIKYKIGSEVKSFIFLPTFHLPFFTHSYIKEIKRNIKSQEKS